MQNFPNSSFIAKEEFRCKKSIGRLKIFYVEGISDEETFKEVYQKIFPLGDSSKYAGLVFKSIDQNQTGAVTFGDFMDFLSMLTKGSVEEKMLWSFHFYDVNKDGYISREEMIKVINGRLNFLSRDSYMMKQKKMMPNNLSTLIVFY